jgi:hypothetical protein
LESTPEYEISSSTAPPPPPPSSQQQHTPQQQQQHETCTTVTTTTEQLHLDELETIGDHHPCNGVNGGGANDEYISVGSPKKDDPNNNNNNNNNNNEVIEATLALSTEIVMSKEDGDEEDEDDDVDGDPDLNLFDDDNINDYQMIRFVAETSSSATPRKKSVFINENLIMNEQIFLAEAETAAATSEMEKKAAKKDKQSTLQRLFKLKI